MLYPSRVLILCLLSACFLSISCGSETDKPLLRHVRTIAAIDAGSGEPFGMLAIEKGIYVSNGVGGGILSVKADGTSSPLINLQTPSGLAQTSDGKIIAVDSEDHTVVQIDMSGTKSTIAGTVAATGSADGPAASASFNGPTGIAVSKEGVIYISDTYNDRIRVIKDGNVSTIAGNTRGFSDGVGTQAMFDTPLGLAMWDDRLLVADAGNRRIRVVEADGRVWTLAGTGEGDLIDGLPSVASFVRPTAIAVSPDGIIYIADGNAIRAMGRRSFGYVETIAGGRRGFADGHALTAKFDRPSGLAVDDQGRLLVADSNNGLIRIIEPAAPPSQGSAKSSKSKKLGDSQPPAELKPVEITADEFRGLQPARWPYDPPEAKRDIAGTLGEIRGEIVDDNSSVWFHNGLDIAGAYGETARFIRSEKVRDPMSTENFGTLRELIRLPSVGYIHIRLGRDSSNVPFGDQRFIFSNENSGKLNGVRVRRGTKFNAGEAIGTLNPMNHVHLIAGPAGSEMNALKALTFPGVSDSIAPVVENVKLFDESWTEIETAKSNERIKLSGKTRIVAKAYDRMDGNPDRRRLGVYRVGYQVFQGQPSQGVNWTITFDRNPPSEAVRTVYAKGSKSGATGETIFNYIVSNRLNANGYGEDFLDVSTLAAGAYTLRVFAADYFGNQSSKDIQFEVIR